MPLLGMTNKYLRQAPGEIKKVNSRCVGAWVSHGQPKKTKERPKQTRGVLADNQRGLRFAKGQRQNQTEAARLLRTIPHLL